jgi:hypothetical protein
LSGEEGFALLVACIFYFHVTRLGMTLFTGVFYFQVARKGFALLVTRIF